MKKANRNHQQSSHIVQRARWIGEVLNRHVPECAIPLQHQDPFTLLCAVLLSAQCTDERVNQVTPALFQLANTPQMMAAAPVEEIEKIIQPCGLFRNKAKALREMAQQLMDRYGGVVPQELADLETLAGVGHKTASVVRVQAFGLPAFAVDTHIARCAERWGLSPSRNVETVETCLKDLFPMSEWGKRHLQIILFARKYCPARGHLADTCPICSQLGKK
jgi:endonuclease-3